MAMATIEINDGEQTKSGNCLDLLKTRKRDKRPASHISLVYS